MAKKRSRGRPPLAESPSRGFLVKAGKRAFVTEGFKSVSVEAICKKAGTSKMTFYRHFGDKLDLAFAILLEFLEQELAWSERLLAEDMPFQEKLSKLLQRREKNHLAFGPKFLSEVAEIKTDAASQFWKSWSERVDAVNIKYLKQGQRVGVISKRVTADIFLFFVKKRNELFVDENLKKICPDQKERMKIIDNFFYYGLSQESVRD